MNRMSTIQCGNYDIHLWGADGNGTCFWFVTQANIRVQDACLDWGSKPNRHAAERDARDVIDSLTFIDEATHV